MLMVFMTLGTALLFAKWASGKAPTGFLFSFLIALFGMVMPPIFGLCFATIAAYSGMTPPEVSNEDLIQSALIHGAQASILMPFVVWHYRRAKKREA